jgi:hypothetical protein
MTDAPPSALARGMTWFGVGYFNDLQQTLVVRGGQRLHVLVQDRLEDASQT